MKTIINKFLLLVTLFAGAASLHGCSDPDGIIEDIAYGREFSPLNFTHTLSNNVNVTFSWTVMAGIADYTLTLSYADGEGGVYDQVDLIAPLDGDGNTVKTMEYSFRELPGNREWIAELVAVSQRAGVADSKPAACAFATGVENLFLNDGKMGDGDVTATTAMLRWVAGSNVTHLDVTPDVGLVKLTSAQIAAGEYELTGLVTGTSYTVGLLRDEAVRGTISFVASGKNVEIREDADYGCNYLDLRGKSTVKEGEAPSQRAVQFSVVGEGVIAIDCYANGAGRNFYAHVDALGKSFGPVEAPTADTRGKVYIPCPGIPASAKVSIWTDATINHIYSIGWYEGAEAPGQNATPLDAPVVTADPASVTKGDNTGVTFSWAAVPNAATYTYRLALTTLNGEAEEVVRLSETVSATRMTVPAETVARLKPGTYTISVTAAAVSDYLYKPSPAGTAALTVADTKLAAPAVKVTPAKVTRGDQTEVTASWDAVDGAASYDVSFNGGASENVTGTSYTIAAATVAGLAAGEYAISVVANPADASAQASDAGTARLTVVEASGPGGDNFAWDFSSSAFSDLIARLTAAGSAGLTDLDETIDGLRILSGGSSFRGGTSSGVSYIQTGGKGTASVRSFSFTASASGKLKVVASNTGSGAATDGRSVTVQIGDDAAGAQSKEAGSGSGEPTTCEFDIAVTGETTVYVYSTINGLRFYSIEYVSDGGSGGGDAGTDYTMTLSATAGVLSSNITGLPTSWAAGDSTWTATDDTGTSAITFTGNIYYSTSDTKNIVWYFNKGKAETHVAASDMGKIRKITINPNSARKPELLTCTYGTSATVLAATEPTGTNSSTISFDFAAAGVDASDFRIGFSDTSTNIEIGKVVIEYTR